MIELKIFMTALDLLEYFSAHSDCFIKSLIKFWIGGSKIIYVALAKKLDFFSMSQDYNNKKHSWK